jgi:hypothetical protein
MLKAEKGLDNKYNIDELARKWNETVNASSADAYNNFIKKYPATLYHNQARRMLNRFAEVDKKRAEETAEQKKHEDFAAAIITYAKEIADQCLWKADLTEAQFLAYNTAIPRAWKRMPGANATVVVQPGTVGLAGTDNSSTGPVNYTVNSAGKIVAYSICTKRVKNKLAETKQFFEQAKAKDVSAGTYFTDNGNSYTIAVPESKEKPFSIKYYISVTLDQVGKWSTIHLVFNTEKQSRNG